MAGMHSCSQPNKNNTVSNNWINDSLSITELNMSSSWVDSAKTNFAFALYRKDTSILRVLSLDSKTFVDEDVIITDQANGTVKISYADPLNYGGEYFIVNQGILEMYNKDGNLYSKAQRLRRKK